MVLKGGLDFLHVFKWKVNYMEVKGIFICQSNVEANTIQVYFISFCKTIFTVTFLIIQNIIVEKIPFNFNRLQKSLNPADMLLLVHPRQEQ